jgi:hypothetical protein
MKLTLLLTYVTLELTSRLAKRSLQMQRNIGTFDRDTGEILEGVSVWVGRKYNPYGRRFVMTNQDALLMMAKDKELTLEPKNVLLYLCGRLDFDNYIQVPQTEIADALEMKKSAVSRAVKLLVAKGILIRGPKVGHSYAFRLNPNYGYKGNPSHLRHDRTGRLYIPEEIKRGNVTHLQTYRRKRVQRPMPDLGSPREPSLQELEELGQQNLFAPQDDPPPPTA